MSLEVDRLVNEVSSLSEIERIEVVSRLLEDQNASLSPKWREEAKRRVAESKAGLTERRSFNELKDEIAEKYGHSKKD